MQEMKVIKEPISPNISIIIPIHNEEKTITQKIENCLELNYPKDKYEIIIVDDFSTDKGKTIVKGYVDRDNRIFLLENQHERGKVGALKTAFNRAKGEVIVLTDADVLVEKDALRKCIEYLMHENVGAVCGIHSSVLQKDNKLFFYEDLYRKIYTRLRLWESKIDSAPVFHGQFYAIKASLKMIPNENTYAEDTDLAIKIRRKGFKTKYMPDCTFYEVPPASLDEFERQKIRRGIGLVQIFWNHKDLFLNPKYGWYGLLIFPLEFTLNVMQPFIALLLYSLMIFSLFRIHPICGILSLLLPVLLSKTKFLKTYLFLNKTLLIALINVFRKRLSPAWNSER